MNFFIEVLTKNIVEIIVGIFMLTGAIVTLKHKIKSLTDNHDNLVNRVDSEFKILKNKDTELAIDLEDIKTNQQKSHKELMIEVSNVNKTVFEWKGEIKSDINVIKAQQEMFMKFTTDTLTRIEGLFSSEK